MRLCLRRVLACAATVALAVGGLAAGGAHAVPSSPPQRLVDDFNGDGYRDVVLNLPTRDTSTVDKAGAVMVLYGSADGLNSSRRKLITENTAGVPGTAETQDAFGYASTAGDFDGDGYADLAVSTLGQDHTFGGTTWKDAGQVTLIWGGPDGLTHHGATTVELAAPTIQRRLAGRDLVSGDFDGDGARDLAVAQTRGGEAGTVLFGPIDRSGSPASRKPLGVETGPPGGYTDTMLTTGDLTGDGITDLLVSWSTRYLGPTDKIHVLRGGADGLTDIGYLKDAAGNPVNHRQDERLATGDLDHDGHDDVIVPHPETSFGAAAGKGAIDVVYGGANGQDPARKPVRFDQDTPNVPDGNSDSGTDHFGKSVATGDVNGDGYLDAIVTSPDENHSHLDNAGKVTVLLGGPGGLTGRGATAFTQNSRGVPGAAIQSGQFGFGVKATDVNGDGRADAMVGVWGADAAGITGPAGGLWTFPGSARGITATGSKAFLPTSLGLPRDGYLYLGHSFDR